MGTDKHAAGTESLRDLVIFLAWWDSISGVIYFYTALTFCSSQSVSCDAHICFWDWLDVRYLWELQLQRLIKPDTYWESKDLSSVIKRRTDFALFSCSTWTFEVWTVGNKLGIKTTWLSVGLQHRISLIDFSFACSLSLFRSSSWQQGKQGIALHEGEARRRGGVHLTDAYTDTQTGRNQYSNPGSLVAPPGGSCVCQQSPSVSLWKVSAASQAGLWDV